MTTDTNDNDRRVSEAYRGVATEKTPPELDRKVLAMAAVASRSRYGRARVWIRPVAWAATIGLSLAFVLEMSQFREATTPQPDTDAVETLEEATMRDEAPAPAQLNAPAAKRASSPPGAAKPTLEARPAAGSASVSDDFEADEMPMLHEVEEQARARAGSERASATAAEAIRFDAAATPETMEREKKERDWHCAPETRSSAEAWYACIEELRDGGLIEAADDELEALLIAFPDFQEPE